MQKNEYSQPSDDILAPVRVMVQACIQCGTCTASCPNSFAMDYTPRHLWRMVLMGQTEEIFNSLTFYMCSACYCCTLRCPRGLPLTEAMETLKQIAVKENRIVNKASQLFYRNFMESVRRHGRVRETEFMTLYFADMKNPFLPFRYMPLGLKLLRKGKMSFQLPSGGNALDALFRKAVEAEAEEAGK